MKFEEKLEQSIRRVWEEHYIDYRALKKVIKAIEKRLEAQAETVSTSSVSGALRQALLPRDSLQPREEEDSEFLTVCRVQYRKVEAFYQEELERESAALDLLLPQLFSASPAVKRRKPSNENVMESPEQPKKQKSKGVKDGRSRARERASCMRASVELFRNLQHLTNFCILNYTGFVKICKKHDKSVPSHMKLWKARLEAELEPLPFVVLEGLGSLTQQLEQGYADAFCDGNLQMAKAALLMRKEKSSAGLSFTLGLQVGACVLFAVWTVWDLYVDVLLLGRARVNTERQWKLLSLMLPIYRACGAIVLGVGLWACCLQCWKAARINYLFMFDLDHDSALSPVSALVLSTRLLVVFLLSSFLFVKAMIKELPHWLCTAPGIFPIAMLLAMVIELLLPARRFRFVTRSLGRVLAAPLFGVDLWSSFVGDVLTSLVKPMTDMAYATCYLVHGEWLMPYTQQGGCAEWWVFDLVVKPLLCALPLWCRFMQSLRVYHDTHRRWPALGNACKYAVAHLVVLFGALHNPTAASVQDSVPDRVMRYGWVALYLVSTLYTFFWDVSIDWRLGSLAHGGLRERRMFSRDWVYHVAIALDLVLRFGWTATLVPGSQSVGYQLSNGDWLGIILTSALASGELCRRAMWAVFRLEAEHLHNTEGLRRIAVIPLHFDPKREASEEVQNADPVRRCGVLVELLAFATIVGVLALLAALTRPKPAVGVVLVDVGELSWGW